MVASKERKTVQAKLDEFYKQACGKQVSPEEKSGKDLIEKTRNDAKKDPNDPNLVQNVQQLFEKYDESDCNRETKIFRKTGTLGPDTVGLEMSIDWLGAKHKTGTPPQSNAQTKLMGRLVTDKHKRSSEKYIRGHLLNENLGGKGDCDNLFPITGNANSQHLHSTEAKIKNWVKEKHNWVFYEVKVKGVSSRLQEDENNIPYNYVNCTLSCHAIRKDKMGEKKEEFSSEISSIFLVKQKAEVKEQTEEEKQKKKTT